MSELKPEESFASPVDRGLLALCQIAAYYRVVHPELASGLRGTHRRLRRDLQLQQEDITRTAHPSQAPFRELWAQCRVGQRHDDIQCR